MTIWFTSDTHFGHVNIIDYCRRPFQKPRQECTLCDANGERVFFSRVQGRNIMPCWHPDVEMQDRELIRRWNERVKPDDVVYHLGDFAFGRFQQVRAYAEQLNGKKVLILGNHDRLRPEQYTAMGFLVRKKWRLGSLRLQHYPMPYPDAKGVTLCGHVHGTFAEQHFKTKPDVVNINVGVDVRGFRPVTLEELGLNPNLAY